MSHSPLRVLIVDDDPVTGDLLCEVFEKEGFVARFEQSSEAALSTLKTYAPNVVVSDIRMKSRNDGLNLLAHLQRECPAIPVILMTAFGSMDTAVRAVREGAFDYISKPFLRHEVVSTVRRALSVSPPVVSALIDDADESDQSFNLIGRNPAMLEIYKTIARAADAQAPILITGESGTGKELIARAIHSQSQRSSAPFVAVNCGALTETLLESELFGHLKGSFTGAITNKKGIFEQAEDGTVFLDEISETSPALQVKLLRVLQEREIVPVGGVGPVNVRARVVAATNGNLDKLCEAGLFRRDLFYRLNVIDIRLPPLRERLDDIPLLVTHLIRKHTPPGDASPLVEDDVLASLLAYPWPGNVRELENVIQRAITLNRLGRITTNDLPQVVVNREADQVNASDSNWHSNQRASKSAIQTIDELEREHVMRALDLTGGNRKRAAELLGINRRTLYRMAERLGIELDSGGAENGPEREPFFLEGIPER
jgi:two-component system, NtrC family, response regulator AtoC